MDDRLIDQGAWKVLSAPVAFVGFNVMGDPLRSLAFVGIATLAVIVIPPAIQLGLALATWVQALRH